MWLRDDYASFHRPTSRHSIKKILNRIAASEIRRCFTRRANRAFLANAAATPAEFILRTQRLLPAVPLFSDRLADELAHPVAVEQQQHVALSRRLL
jgi:hypothetical protein